MNTQKKLTKKEEELLARFKDAQIKECFVSLVKMDIEPLLLVKKPLSDEDIERILEDSSCIASESSPGEVISPQSKSRLRKNENGMVFIPRSKYNEHPAKNIISTRKSKRSSIIKVKLSPRSASKKKSLSPIKETKNNNSIYKKGSSSNKSTPNRSSTNNNSNKYICGKFPEVVEYHLVFSPPKNIENKKKNFNSLKSLSEFIKVESLPSKLWEMERVPPFIPCVENDSIAEQLLALTEENKENLADGSDKSAESESSSQDVDSKTRLSVAASSKDSHSESDGKEQEIKTEDGEVSSLKDELEALLSDTDAFEKYKTKDALKSEDTSGGEITSEDIEKTIKDVEMEADAAKATLPEEETKCSAAMEVEESANIKDSVVLKSAKKEKSVHFKEELDQKKKTNMNEDVIKCLIFRKYAENKKSYEKVVVFRSSMEYTVTINNKPVEFIGAPEEMSSIDDLKILLQIVDESNLDSFNVICKS